MIISKNSNNHQYPYRIDLGVDELRLLRLGMEIAELAVPDPPRNQRLTHMGRVLVSNAEKLDDDVTGRF